VQALAGVEKLLASVSVIGTLKAAAKTVADQMEDVHGGGPI